MPLHLRPLQPSDEPALQRRFGPQSKAPWLQLPSPYSLDALLTPRDGLTVLVAEWGREEPVGLIAVDESEDGAMLVGPLVRDEQLADLLGRAMLDDALAWAEAHGLERVQAKADGADDRAIGFFTQRGFSRRSLPRRLLTVRPAEARAPEPVLDAFRFSPCPELLSSEYLKLAAGIGDAPGWAERADWDRPQVIAHLQNPELPPFVVRQGDALIGLAEIEPLGEGSGRIGLFGVLPAWRGSEIEEAFLAHVLRHAATVLRLERLEVSAVLDDEHPDYLGAGFSVVQEEVLFEKRLGAPVEAESTEA